MEHAFVDKLAASCKKHEIKPQRLQIELTETTIMDNVEVAVTKMQQLKTLGFSVAIDDFGTGYSSINYLLKLPFDVLKIDRNFVSGIDLSNDLENLCRIIVEMGHSLNKAIVAEGVENQQELEKLASLNCEMIQGYFFSKPVSVDEMANLIKQGSF